MSSFQNKIPAAIKIQYTEKQKQEILDLAELARLYKQDGLNRLKIWKQMRDNGINRDIILEALRAAGMV